MKKPRLAVEADTGRKCALCRKAIRVGEPIYPMKFATRGFDDPIVIQHTACMGAVADAAPEPGFSPTDVAAYIAAARRAAAAYEASLTG